MGTLPILPRKTDPSRGGNWGILGGSFNPVHIGHLIIAESALNSVEADGMIFVPARSHPFKSDAFLADYQDRVEMTRRAIAGNDRFRLEETPAGSKYTIDQIEYLRGRYPTAVFFLVLGSDIVEEFSTWYKYEKIEQSLKIVVAARPGYDIGSENRKGIKSAEYVMIPQYDVCSSDIRERIKSGMSIKYMVPEAVENYLTEKALYAE